MRGLLTLVLAGLLAACSVVPTPSATPRPTVAPTWTPLPDPLAHVEVGVPVGVTINTHCGLDGLLVNGEAFLLDGPETANPPPGFDGPLDTGTFVLDSETTATYTSSHGVVVTLHRVRPIPTTGHFCL